MWGRFKRSISQTIDQGIGTTFDSHVIAAYRFVMRYYEDGDKIFLFGFSRGAFTARFLARMIATIGVLSKGNEEMVPFAYKSYQDYENGVGKFKSEIENRKWMDSFRTTFCRQDVKVHFLGLFDTVNSVGYFDLPFTTKTYLPKVAGTAQHVRHAVSIDERRCKFKPALLEQDLNACKHNHEDVKEVYFAGNHGDIGGGWLAEGNKDVVEADDPVQLSDIALQWMITELRELPVNDPAERLAFNEHVDIFLNNINRKIDQAYRAKIHDVLKFGGGVSAFKVLFWNFLGEVFFFIFFFFFILGYDDCVWPISCRGIVGPDLIFGCDRIHPLLRTSRTGPRQMEVGNFPPEHGRYAGHSQRRRLS